MPEILTVKDVEAFLARVRATLAVAEEGDVLKAALARLVEGEIAPVAVATPTKRARGRRPAPRVHLRPARPTAATADAILALFGDHPRALAMSDFKAALGGGEKTIRRRLQKLVEQGLLQRTGERRGTRYEPAAAAAAAASSSAAAPASAPTASVQQAPAPAKTDIIAQVRKALADAYDGRPVRAETVAWRVQGDVDLVDSALTYLATVREAKAVGGPGRRAYIPTSGAGMRP